MNRWGVGLMSRYDVSRTAVCALQSRAGLCRDSTKKKLQSILVDFSLNLPSIPGIHPEARTRTETLVLWPFLTSVPRRRHQKSTREKKYIPCGFVHDSARYPHGPGTRPCSCDCCEKRGLSEHQCVARRIKSVLIPGVYPSSLRLDDGYATALLQRLTQGTDKEDEDHLTLRSALQRRWSLDSVVLTLTMLHVRRHTTGPWGLGYVLSNGVAIHHHSPEGLRHSSKLSQSASEIRYPSHRIRLGTPHTRAKGPEKCLQWTSTEGSPLPAGIHFFGLLLAFFSLGRTCFTGKLDFATGSKSDSS